MTEAERLMKKKAVFKAELDGKTPESDAIWRKATERLEEILMGHASLPKGVRTHTDKIFPAAAIYLTAKEAIGEGAAFAVIEDAAVKSCARISGKIAGLMKIPGMSGLFVRMWDPLTRKMFGQDCGFENVFYPKKKGEYRMDVIACPYCRFLTELGCPELTRIFCENDERVYGNLPGVRFERRGTLGKGADRCDFYVRKK